MNYDIRDIIIFSGELEIENILTIGDIFDYNLSWDFEEREEGRQYPGNGKTIFKILKSFEIELRSLAPFTVFNYILRHEFENAKTELHDDLE